MSGRQESRGRAAAHTGRSCARLAAVQALFQMEQSEQGLVSVLADYGEIGSGLDDQGRTIQSVDADLFRSLVTGVADRQTQIDQIIRDNLAAGWRIERIDTISRAILRAALCEFLICPDVPTSVVIDEYVWLAGSFLDSEGTGFVNGILETVSRQTQHKAP